MAELRANAIDTVYHTGLQIDEVLARYGSAGNKTLLTDALMSVIAKANDGEAIDNVYSYSPYGQVQSSGQDGGNSLQYTGRENDQTGLYYYRARYYDPILKRFISQDPIGIEGGINLYAYVGGNPVSCSDPEGLLFTTTMGGLRNDMTLNQAIDAGAPGSAAVGATAITIGTTAAVGAGVYGYFGELSAATRAAIEVAKGITTDAMPPPTTPIPPTTPPPVICRPGFPNPPPNPPPWIIPR